MGLTLVTREDGSTGYEYLEEDEMRQKGSHAALLPTLHSDDRSGFAGQFNRALAGATRAESDDNFIVGSLKTVPRMAHNAAVGALQETSDSLRYLGEVTGIAPEGTSTTEAEPDKPIIGLGGWKPTKANNDEAWLSGLEDFGTGVGQFAIEWVALSKALKGANWALKSSKVPALVKASKIGSKIAQTEKTIQSAVATKTAATLGGGKAAQFIGRRVAGPVVGQGFRSTVEGKGMAIDFFGFDPWEGNLITLAANSEVFGFLNNIPLAKALIVDPDDTETERRFKQVVEGWGIDFTLGGTLNTIAAKPIDTADLLTQVAKANGFTKQLADAAKEFGTDSVEVAKIEAKIEAQAERLAKNPIVHALELQRYKAPELPLPKALQQADQKQPLSLFLRTAAFEDQAFIAINRLEEAMNKFVAPDRKGKPRKPIDTVGDLVNLLNVARVATEEGVQKALRDVNNLLLPQDQRPERELLIGVQGWRKRMEAGKLATNRQITQMLGDQPTPPPTKQIPGGPPTQNVVPTPPPVTEIPPTKGGEAPTVAQQYVSKQYRDSINQLTAQLKALGNPPPKPGKGKSFYADPGDLTKKKWTPAYKKWRDYQKKSKPITDAINKLIKENNAAIKENQAKINDPVETKLTTEEFQTRIESTGKKSPDYSTRFKSWNPYEQGWFDNTGDLSRRGYGAWEKLATSKKVPAGDMKKALDFMDKIGREKFQDIAPQILDNLPQKGRYDFLRKVILIQKEAIEKKQFKQTAIHELWHTLSRFLPKVEVNQLRNEFKREQAKYLGSLPKPELEAFKRGEYTEANYRYKDIDEYFTERMLDLWSAHELIEPPEPGTLGAVIESVLSFFNQIFNNIRAELGINATHKIFNNFVNQRYSKVYRNTKLEYDSIGRNAPSSTADLPDFNRDKNVDGDPNRPGETRTNAQMTDEILRNFVDNLERVKTGELDLLDAYGYSMQDIINIQSAGKSKTLYADRDLNSEAWFKAASDATDRVTATGMAPIDIGIMAENALKELNTFGLNLREVDESTKLLRYIARNNPEFVKRIFNLRVAVHALGKEAGTKAANVMNAMNNGQLNWNKSVAELEKATTTSLKYFRQYQQITRMLGQNFRALQAKIGDISDINIIPDGEYLPVYDLDITKMIAERDDIVAAAAGDPKNIENVSFGKVFGDDVKEAMATGKWGPGAKSKVNEIANVIADSAYKDGEGIGTIDRIMRGPDLEDAADLEDAITTKKDEIGGGTLASKTDRGKKFELFMKSLGTHKVSSILSAGSTYAIQSAIPYTRILMEPALDLFNQSVFPKGSLIPFDPKAFTSRLPITAIWYRQIFLQHYGALKLAAKAFRDGQTYFDAYRHPGAFDDNNRNIAAAVKQAEGGQPIKLDGKRGAFNLNEAEALRAMTNDPTAIMVGDAYWKFATFDVRAQASIETFQKSLVGNSMLYAIGAEEGYEQALVEGLKGLDAWAYAEEWAKAKVDFFTHDAIVNGKTVTGAINSHPTALKIGRMVTFTDDIRARMENRSFSYGQELARQSGIDPNDFDAINKFALEYIEGTADIDQFKYRANNSWLSRKLRGEATNIPLAGEKTPSMTGAWSYLPSIWAGLQRKRFGWLATQIQPFVRSPAEIMKQAARTIPGLNFTVDTFYRDAFDESSFFSNHWKSELATGAVAMTVFSQLLDNDDIQITGAGPLNNESRSLWEARNMRPMSFRKKFIGEDGIQRWSQWESYRAYEPVATILRTMADFKDMSVSMTHQQREQASALLVFNLAGEVIKGNLQASYYQGILDFLDGGVTPLTGSAWGQTGAGFARPKRVGEVTRTERWLNKMVVSAFPHSSRVRALTQMIDPYKRASTGAGGEIIDEEIGQGKAGMVWEWEGDSENIGGTYPYRKTFKLPLIEGFLTEIKKNTPFWSQTLPVRRNWVTGDPLYNAGFLHDDEMPLDDEPWLQRLTSAFVLTHLPIAYSAIPVVGALPEVTGRTGHEEIVKNDYVTAELMRLRGFGTRYVPPSPADIQPGTKLTTEGYDQYLKYLSQYPDPTSNMTLSQELFRVMNSNAYLKQPPEVEGDELTRSARAEMLQPIFNKFRKNAKWLFINDPENPYVLEVLPTKATQVLKELDKDFAVKFGAKQSDPSKIKAGTKKRVSATEYIQSVQ